MFFDPYFGSLADFIAMGDHGFFVWSAYALSALLIIANMMLAVRRHRQVRAEIARQERRAARDAAASSSSAKTNVESGVESSE